jgi:hypothetical protein
VPGAGSKGRAHLPRWIGRVDERGAPTALASSSKPRLAEQTVSRLFWRPGEPRRRGPFSISRDVAGRSGLGLASPQVARTWL